VILPIFRDDDARQQVMDYANSLAADLRAVTFGERKVEVEVDARDLRGGLKSWEWIKKGAPLRIEVGPRDVESSAVTLYRRDQAPKDKRVLPRAELVATIASILEEMQKNLFEKARAYRDANTKVFHDRKSFDAFFTPKNADKPEIHGGFAIASWCGSPKCEGDIKDALKVTIRCLPTGGFEGTPWASALSEKGPCVVCGQPSERRAVFAKSY
jgi:prolyl-tRNA synthetase